MEIRTPKMYQLIMTGLGLLMFALAITLNHFHPHNQGVADITHGSIYKKFGISNSGNANAPLFYYMSPLANSHPSTAPKLTDPTSSSPADNSHKSLPAETLANGQPDPNTPTDQSPSTSPANSSQSNSQDSANNQKITKN